MPEGPSIVILKEFVKELNVEGQTIRKVTGTADLDIKRMQNQKIITFKTWGKHFLICFKDFTLRIHLMMFGSYRINSHKESKPKIGFQFENAEINFYTCAANYIEGNLNEVYDWTADIMGKKWNTKNTIEKLKKEPQAMVCDVLLDQQIFAGAGNIIKNEVLYRTKIQPQSNIRALPAKKLKELVEETKNYAFDFLKWKKANTLKKHWEVYSKKVCPQHHKVTKQELGKNKRVSYYCEKCQKQYN